MSKTRAQINREIDELWADALEHRAAAHAAYMKKLDLGGYGSAEKGQALHQADRVMKQHEQASRACRAKGNRLGALRRKLFGR